MDTTGQTGCVFARSNVSWTTGCYVNLQPNTITMLSFSFYGIDFPGRTCCSSGQCRTVVSISANLCGYCQSPTVVGAKFKSVQPLAKLFVSSGTTKPLTTLVAVRTRNSSMENATYVPTRTDHTPYPSAVPGSTRDLHGDDGLACVAAIVRRVQKYPV